MCKNMGVGLGVRGEVPGSSLTSSVGTSWDVYWEEGLGIHLCPDLSKIMEALKCP